jgi:hypothetical protein
MKKLWIDRIPHQVCANRLFAVRKPTSTWAVRADSCFTQNQSHFSPRLMPFCTRLHNLIFSHLAHLYYVCTCRKNTTDRCTISMCIYTNCGFGANSLGGDFVGLCSPPRWVRVERSLSHPDTNQSLFFLTRANKESCLEYIFVVVKTMASTSTAKETSPIVEKHATARSYGAVSTFYNFLAPALSGIYGSSQVSLLFLNYLLLFLINFSPRFLIASRGKYDKFLSNLRY